MAIWSGTRGEGMAVALTHVAEPAQPIGTDVLPAMDDNEFAAYERTCQAIGFEPLALLEAQILAFMAEKKMKQYDAEKVDKYLTAKAKKLGPNHYWAWRPLRASDESQSDEFRLSVSNLWTSVWIAADGSTGTSASIGPAGGAYQKAVPLRVLGRVEQFIQKFGDKVRFLVSDYAERRPDPFIAVVPKNGKNEDAIIFDMWDEPDFK